MSFARRFARILLVTLGATLVALAFHPSTARAAEQKQEQGQMGQHEGHMAQHEGSGKMPSSMAQLMKMDPVECMKMMDPQHKGFVTKKEFMKFQEQLWNKMDKNHDGKVNEPEFTDAG